MYLENERENKMKSVDQELSTTTTVRINVLDVNEAPVVVHTHVFSIKEHSRDGGARGGTAGRFYVRKWYWY